MSSSMVCSPRGTKGRDSPSPRTVRLSEPQSALHGEDAAERRAATAHCRHAGRIENWAASNPNSVRSALGVI